MINPDVLEATISEEILEGLIAEETYVILGQNSTVCNLKLKSGFSIIGCSYCANMTLFDEELEKQYAKSDAFQKLWGFELYHQMRIKPEGRRTR